MADVGCGKGASTLLMAKAFPKSHFFGFDYHPESIEAARESAKRAGLSDRVTFEVAKAKEFPGMATTSLQSSTACTTWATQSEQPRTSGNHWPKMARG